MSDSEQDYLQPGFDPETLRVPQLRSILVRHNVPYPANAKKAQLIDIFSEHVVPQSRKLLAARARVKRMSQGIVDAGSSHDLQTVSSVEYDHPTPSKPTRSRSPRKSSRVKHESEEPDHHDTVSTVSSTRKRQSRTASRQTSVASDFDADMDGSRSVRSSRRTVTPSVKLEPPEEESDMETPRPVSDEESVFTADNPFQSGSSPVPVKTPSTRRKTTGMDSARPKSSSGTRRRTDGPHLPITPDSSFSNSFEIPETRPTGSKTPEPQPMEAGEEFTLDEQLELAQEAALSGESAVVPRRQPASTRRRTSLATPFWALLLTLLGAYAAWYRREKIAVGYCGVGRAVTPLISTDVQLPEWLDWAKPYVPEHIELPEWATEVLEPQCEPCPAHAYCYEDLTARCEPGFILKPHPLSLGGVIPLPPTCEPDSEKARRVKAVAEKAVEELRDRTAKWECGHLKDEEGRQPETPAIEEPVLREVISEKRSKKMSKQEFDDLWVAALGEIESMDEVVVEHKTSGAGGTTDSTAVSNKFLSSTSLARLPLSCALRRSVRLGLARYRLHLSTLILAVLGSLYARMWYRSHRAAAAQVPALVDTVLERLATQKDLSYESGSDDEPFLFLPNLRDDVLRSIHLLAQRERLWQRVRAVVEQNSNVRTGQREGHNGEVGRAWEWIGPSSGNAITDSTRRRRSGRVSWGPDVKGEEDDDVKPALAAMSENKAGIHRKWEESRPIY